MTEDLQQLLDRIRREGIEKAETEAKAIVEAARKEAAETLAKAKTEAEDLRKEAEKDARAFAQRAEQQVRQAVRDVNLQVAQDLENQVVNLLGDDVKGALADRGNVANTHAYPVAGLR